tara:strand:- start:5583 stop:5852 length:270 start_codon:yes stop_codon:yes gene_type:complete
VLVVFTFTLKCVIATGDLDGPKVETWSSGRDGEVLEAEPLGCWESDNASSLPRLAGALKELIRCDMEKRPCYLPIGAQEEVLRMLDLSG